MATNSLIKAFYEEADRKISDRTWLRIKRRLKIQEPIPESKFAEVGALLKAYAYLRKTYPNRSLHLVIVQRFLDFRASIADKGSNQCTGQEIYDLAKRLTPCPSDSTIYRWGDEIGLPFRKSKTYQGDEFNKWVEKIATNPRYTYCKEELRGITDSEQDQSIA